MKSSKRYMLIIFISAVILICSYSLLSHRKIETDKNSINNPVSTRVAGHIQGDSLKNNDTIKFRKITNPGADIRRKSGSGTEIQRPAGPDKPAGAGKKAGAAKIKKK